MITQRVRQEWQAFFAAVEFLTRIPVFRIAEYSPDDLPRSTPYFPLVGLLVGAAGAVAFLVSRLFWPQMLAVVISVAATVRLTGAFHEDAVADLFDGFGGGWTREQVFRIMKDSRVGAYGVVGLLLVIGAKVLALDAIAVKQGAEAASLGATCLAIGRALVAGHVLGRWSSLPLIWHYPYVRPASADEQPGTGKPFASSVTNGRLLAGTLLAVAIVALAMPGRVVLLVPVAALVTALCGSYFRRRIGGITGDTLGGANQLVELATYLVLAATPLLPWT
ncbi:MAG: adenosylcobinamide-GDP ribazoletransferase [bacterium]